MYRTGKNIPVWSVIVFSDECALKDITVSSKNVRVVQCRYVTSTVDQICNEIQGDFLTETEVINLYNHLLPYTDVSEEEKERHARKAFEARQRF